MRDEKLSIVKDILNVLDNSMYLFVLSYKGFKVKNLEQIKLQICSDNLTRCQIIKNSLFLKAMISRDRDRFLNRKLGDSNMLVYGKNSDFFTTLKNLNSIVSKSTGLSFKIGYSISENQLFFDNEVEQVAKLPSREVLLSRCIGTISMSYGRVINLLNLKLLSVLIVLKSFCDKKQSSNS